MALQPRDRRLPGKRPEGVHRMAHLPLHEDVLGLHTSPVDRHEVVDRREGSAAGSWYVIATRSAGDAQSSCSTFQDAHARRRFGISRVSVWRTTWFAE